MHSGTSRGVVQSWAFVSLTEIRRNPKVYNVTSKQGVYPGRQDNDALYCCGMVLRSPAANTSLRSSSRPPNPRQRPVSQKSWNSRLRSSVISIILADYVFVYPKDAGDTEPHLKHVLGSPRSAWHYCNLTPPLCCSKYTANWCSWIRPEEFAALGLKVLQRQLPLLNIYACHFGGVPELSW